MRNAGTTSASSRGASRRCDADSLQRHMRQVHKGQPVADVIHACIALFSRTEQCARAAGWCGDVLDLLIFVKVRDVMVQPVIDDVSKNGFAEKLQAGILEVTVELYGKYLKPKTRDAVRAMSQYCRARDCASKHKAVKWKSVSALNMMGKVDSVC